MTQYITIVSKSYPAVVQYGACANDDNGFTISFFAIAGLPMTFYITYNGMYGSTLLEGEHCTPGYPC